MEVVIDPFILVLPPGQTGVEPVLPFSEAIFDILLGPWAKSVSVAPVDQSVAHRHRPAPGGLAAFSGSLLHAALPFLTSLLTGREGASILSVVIFFLPQVHLVPLVFQASFLSYCGIWSRAFSSLSLMTPKTISLSYFMMADNQLSC